MTRKRRFYLPALLACLVLFFALGTTPAAEKIRFQEAKFKQGELKYFEGIPVLLLQGTPEEIGEQHGKLVVDGIGPLLKYPQEFLKQNRLQAAWPVLVTASKALLKRVPKFHHRELDAAVAASGQDGDILYVANTMLELRRFGGCSTIVIGRDRSATGGMLFGRNFDFPPRDILDKFGLVTVFRSKGKHAFLAVGFPGMVGVFSGMNEKGLALATLDVYSSKDESPYFDPGGVPLAFTFRRILEECTTVAEAENILRSAQPTTWMNLTVCDKQKSVVFELTPKSVVVRNPEEDLLYCTNHFRSSELCTSKNCRRYDALEKCAKIERPGIGDVARFLHEVNQNSWTIQSMIFEPETLKLHVGLGKGPVTARSMTVLELKPLFEGTSAETKSIKKPN